MEKVKDIQLTNDPLTNIKIMTPYLNEKHRMAVGGMMFGMFLAEHLDRKENKENKEKEGE